MANAKLHDTGRTDLLKIKVPKATASYAPVSHRQVIEMTMEELDRNGLRVISEGYRMARDGRQAMGFYNIGANGDSEMQIRLGWHNSYDKSMPLRWAIGANIIICTNGMVAGDLGAFKRKHTGPVLDEYREQIKTHIGAADKMFTGLIKDREQMRNIEITKRTASELIGRMFLEEDIITATQIGIIKRELETPTYDYKADGTVWQLYNHATFALKEEHPQRFIDSHIDVHRFFKNEYQLS